MEFKFICGEEELVLNGQGISDLELKFNLTSLGRIHIDVGQKLYECYINSEDSSLVISDTLFEFLKDLTKQTYAEVQFSAYAHQ